MFRKYSSIAEVEKILDLDGVSPQKRWVSRTWLADDLAMRVFEEEFREWLKTWPWVTRWTVPFLHPPLRWLDEFRWRRQAKLFAEELKKIRDRSEDAKVVRWQLTKKEVEGLRKKIGHYALFYGYPASDAGWESLPFLLYKFAYGQFLEAESQWSTLDMDGKKYILALRCGEKKVNRPGFGGGSSL